MPSMRSRTKCWLFDLAIETLWKLAIVFYSHCQIFSEEWEAMGNCEFLRQYVNENCEIVFENITYLSLITRPLKRGENIWKKFVIWCRTNGDTRKNLLPIHQPQCICASSYKLLWIMFISLHVLHSVRIGNHNENRIAYLFAPSYNRRSHLRP